MELKKVQILNNDKSSFVILLLKRSQKLLVKYEKCYRDNFTMKMMKI